MSRIFVSGALCLGVLALGLASGQNCAEDKVRKCMAIAEPMLKDPHLIFPDNMNDINNVCRTWSNFVECIRRYIDKCFSKVRKDQFNSAVEPPIASVHQMCSVSSYQAEYLQYAGCIKSTIVEAEHCGSHYSVLVNEVSQENVRKANLCCAYHNFRSCVISKTRTRCDANQPEGIAARFSRQVLDKAFHFLQDQCFNYMPDTGKCGSIGRNASRPTSSRQGEGRSVVLDGSRKPQESGRGKTGGELMEPVTHGARSTVMREATMRPPGPSASSVAPSTRQVQPEDGPPEPAPHYTLGSTGPAATQRAPSYGRAISWTTAPPSTSPTTPATTAPPTTTASVPEIPEWATNTWFTLGQDLTTEEIYPAAGSFGGNNIDEPNQQGLSRSGQSTLLAVLVHVAASSAAALLLL